LGGAIFSCLKLLREHKQGNFSDKSKVTLDKFLSDFRQLVLPCDSFLELRQAG
jgi:hypothetical protein